MDEDDMDDDDTPRVVYADAEREGRMARYATGVGDGAEASRGSHDASQGGVFAYRGDAPGAAPWAFELDMDSAPPPTLLEDEDDQARSPARVDARTAPHGAFRSGGVREKRGLREDTTTRSDTRSDSDDDELVAAFPAAARVTSGSPSIRANPKTAPSRAAVGAADADHADRDFLEQTLGNKDAAKRVMANERNLPKKAKPKPKPKPQLRSPRGNANLATKAIAVARAAANPPKGTGTVGGGLASLASLGALSRGEVVAAAPTDPVASQPPARPTQKSKPTQSRKPTLKLTQKHRTLASSRAARREADGDEVDSDDSEDDGIDDDSASDDSQRGLDDAHEMDTELHKELPKTSPLPTKEDDAVPCTEGEDDAAEKEKEETEKSKPLGLMSAMSRLPTSADALSDEPFAFRAKPNGSASQRGSVANRHGHNAPTARLQRIAHRARARSAQFAHARDRDETDLTQTQKDQPQKTQKELHLLEKRAAAWGSPMALTLVGEGAVEAGLCLWECVEGASEFPNANGSTFRENQDNNTEHAESPGSPVWLRRGADAPAPGLVVVFDAKTVRELRLNSGAHVRVYPPWNEVEVPPGVGTGFKRRRVVMASLVGTG